MTLVVFKEELVMPLSQDFIDTLEQKNEQYIKRKSREFCTSKEKQNEGKTYEEIQLRKGIEQYEEEQTLSVLSRMMTDFIVLNKH